jgi:hypothetical protein
MRPIIYLTSLIYLKQEILLLRVPPLVTILLMTFQVLNGLLYCCPTLLQESFFYLRYAASFAEPGGLSGSKFMVQLHQGRGRSRSIFYPWDLFQGDFSLTASLLFELREPILYHTFLQNAKIRQYILHF